MVQWSEDSTYRVSLRKGEAPMNDSTMTPSPTRPYQDLVDGLPVFREANGLNSGAFAIPICPVCTAMVWDARKHDTWHDEVVAALEGRGDE